MRTFTSLLVLTLILALRNSGASAASCEERTRAAFTTYQLTSGSAEKGAPVDDPARPYSRTAGDFDGDGKEDVALLLRPVPGQGKYAISVCLSSKPLGSPMLIQNAYTYGPLSTTPKGRKYYDFETSKEGSYELDGIGSYCCECCGATYILRNGAFVEVVDSD